MKSAFINFLATFKNFFNDSMLSTDLNITLYNYKCEFYVSLFYHDVYLDSIF